jgi:histone-lysine N-methyltransferase SETD2
MLKELRHCLNVEDLECNDNVKHKAKDFIRKYMSKFGAVYKRPPDD